MIRICILNNLSLVSETPSSEASLVGWLLGPNERTLLVDPSFVKQANLVGTTVQVRPTNVIYENADHVVCWSGDKVDDLDMACNQGRSRGLN